MGAEEGFSLEPLPHEFEMDEDIRGMLAPVKSGRAGGGHVENLLICIYIYIYIYVCVCVCMFLFKSHFGCVRRRKCYPEFAEDVAVSGLSHSRGGGFDETMQLDCSTNS